MECVLQTAWPAGHAIARCDWTTARQFSHAGGRTGALAQTRFDDLGTAWAMAEGGTGSGLKPQSRGRQPSFNRRVLSLDFHLLFQ